jgi:hypothetical protein
MLMQKSHRSDIHTPSGRWLRDGRFSWFAGIPSGGLESEQCLSERAFYNGLGFAVLMSAMISSLTLMLSLAYVLHATATRLWPIGLLWFAVILNVDRLLQIVVTSKRMWIGAIPRALVTLVLGVLISEPLLVVLNGPEISRALAAQTQTAVQSSTRSVESFYQPMIANAQHQVVTIERQENALRMEIVRDTFVANCETSEVNCSLTHRMGCGPVCGRYRQLARVAQIQLVAALPLDRAAMARLQGQIATLTNNEQRAVATGRVSIENGSGFIAREEVLGHLMSTSTPVLYEVWLLRAAFWLLDLLPLILKYLHVASGSAAYDRVMAARRRQEAAGAHRIDAATRVERARVDDQADADIETNRIAIWADRDRRIRDSEGAYGWNGARGPASTVSAISAVSLSDFVDGGWITHESQPVDVPPALRRAGWAGTALVTSLAVALTLLSWDTGAIIPGTALIDVASIAVLGIAAYTRGFSRANHWALYATSASLVAGLAFPLLIAFLNL